ncbi:hypothetical protein FB567DRAFT_588188 [Paraphoma chrysanthemicola]|uniref:Uncharacterized protein n=1 Tax=Paraphoma chrysanthemicola TaxID=798071 RepID=A0A8K0W3T1_9PLEO|nr:hypothetical protein FB567DRAFT_588188 [Paraphoma chrysanthemicola]
MLSILKTTTKVTLALCLPLFIRACNHTHLGIAIAITATISYFVLPFLGHKYTPGHKTRAKSLLIPVWVFLASCIADFVLYGPWPRLLLTYLMSWEPLFLLFPHNCNQNQIRVKKIRTTHPLSPEMLVPMFISATIVFYTARAGLLQGHDSIIVLIINSALLICAHADPLQHLAVFITSLFGNGEEELEELVLMEEEPGVEPKKEWYTMQEPITDVEELSELTDLENVSSTQSRPSTRRRA